MKIHLTTEQILTLFYLENDDNNPRRAILLELIDNQAPPTPPKQPQFDINEALNIVLNTPNYFGANKIQAIKALREFAGKQNVYIPLVQAKLFVENI